MKRILSFIFIISMVLAMFTTIYADVNFTDVKETDWFYSNVKEMVNLGMIEGYPDNTFKPRKAVKADEFIKMVLVAFNYDIPETDSTYWADKFIKIAEKEGIVSKNTVSDYRFEITREQVARIVTNTLFKTEARPTSTYEEYIKNAMFDYHLIADEYKQDMIDCYSLGIMQGDDLEKVNPQKSITRAEATAVILRMIDNNRRLECNFNADVENSEFTINDIEGNPHTFIAPIFNGEPAQEMIDIAYILQEEMQKTKGAEFFSSSIGGNDIGFTGYETQVKQDFCYDDNNLTNENLALMSKYTDFDFNVDFLEYKTEYSPYELVLWKNIAWASDEKYKAQWDLYKEYFSEYYKEPFEKMFKLWFEDEFETAWNLFMTGLSNTDVEYTVIEKTINERNFFIQSDNSFVTFAVSLKGQHK
ncbi:S-layer homology domain-containing protein [Sedimentibacter sp. zth1]|uniref:S-layer homology domain-containing protein n=1 Tax=Sedimentibacter sp. zth1 TaxID=2816908 RepID=UPI001A928D00|nr:S-layer homology domain-containing protein [Sedimentibacter sp. zth1]QSX05476.1 S-layer homology domain-containing protein [Sedimentibacter sp. zth1]